jgi:hypothetical protein
MLRRSGLKRKWCTLIAHCISTVCFSVLINDTPISFFNSSYGLRQGDLLSLLLFVMVMEALGKMIHVAVNKGFLSS